MKAREWLDKGNQTSDPIDSFSYFWRAFNNLFSTVGNGTEKNKIGIFLNQRIPEAQAKEVLENNASSVLYLLSQPVIDMRDNGNNTAPNIHAFNTTDDLRAKLKELFMVIYQVRCNLEHGQKSPSQERDIELCRSAAPFVAYVVDKSSQ